MSMQRRTALAWAIAAALTGALAGCAPGGATGGSTSGADNGGGIATAEPAPQADREYAITIDGSALSVDYSGAPVIIVDYSFTNNSDSAQSFMIAFNAQAFQGGIELDGFAIGVEGIDSSLSMADVQPGSTVAVRVPYVLRDQTPVMVEVRELISFDDTVLASQEFAVA